MTKEALVAKIVAFVAGDEGNFIDGGDAIYPELAGMKIYDSPLVGFASADDPLFTAAYKKEGIIHPEYMAPEEWLAGAKTVISYFLPFTAEVRESNRKKKDAPYQEDLPQRCSAEWLHGRIEGQIFMLKVGAYILGLLEEWGFSAVCPAASKKFRLITPFISNWSERHAAHAAGLGTFGLSKGLITAKGMAGRFGSVITTACHEPDERAYSNPFEYCNMCGSCMAKCPAGAIDKARGCALGKDQPTCHAYVSGGKLPPRGANMRVRFGCGKCQCGVPCEDGIPKNRQARER